MTSVTFPANTTQLTRTFNVVTLNDTLDEDPETFAMTLTSANNANLSPNQPTTAFGQINDNDNPPSVKISDCIVVEGNVGQVACDLTVGLFNSTTPAISGKTITVDRPDILIVEGLNVLQTGRPPRGGQAIPFVSDFFDFSVYLDADEKDLRDWYVTRFFSLRDTAFRNPKSYFHRYAALSDEEARATANRIWDTINLVNLRENLLPTRQRADLILRKGADHIIHSVWLRKL